MERLRLCYHLAVLYRVCGGGGLECYFTLVDRSVELVLLYHHRCGRRSGRTLLYGLVYVGRYPRLAQIVRRFENAELPQKTQQMAEENQLPIRLVQQLLSRLEETNIVRRVYIEQAEYETFIPAMDTRIITVEMVIGRISAQGTEEFLQHTPQEMQDFWQRYLKMCESNTSENILVSELG